MSDLVLLPAPVGRLLAVEAGVVDDRARFTFTNGHCHSLALAFHRKRSWPMIGLYRADGECRHILACRSEDELIDIGGLRTRREALDNEPATHVRDVTVDEVRLWREEDWAEPYEKVAADWIEPLLVIVDRGDPHATTPGLTVTFSHPSGLDVMVTWDGETHLIAYVREAASPEADWTRCNAIPCPRHSTGAYVIEYSRHAFEQRARRYFEHHFDAAAASEKLS